VIRDSRVIPDHLRLSHRGARPANESLTKEVVISASELEKQDPGSEGMDGYLDPALLYSQNSFQKKQLSGFQMNISSTPSSFSASQDQLADTASENDVSKILSQVKAMAANPKLGALSSSQTQKRGIGEVFSRSSSEMTSAVSSRSSTHPPNPLLLKTESTLSARLRDKFSAGHSHSTTSLARSGSETKKTIGLHSSDSFSASQLDSVPPPVPPSNETGHQSQGANSQTGIRAFFSQELSQPTGPSQEQSQPPPARLSKSSKEIFKDLIGWSPPHLSCGSTALQPISRLASRTKPSSC
jgi:hypothetical protein